MNYLAHAFLSFGDADILIGNMIADHVKGKNALTQYPTTIQNGIMLHRGIDGFTDTHPAIDRAKIHFKEVYGLYAGAIVDVILDYFLANDALHFASEEAVFTFSQETYKQLETNSQWMPPKFAQYFPYMKEQNWLYNYRTLAGIKKSLQGLQKRGKYIPPIDDAYNTLVGHYYYLNQCYLEFMNDAIAYVKNYQFQKAVSQH